MIGWGCDFCKRFGLVISRAGIIYCPYCRISYGKTMTDLLINSLEYRKEVKRNE
jgi:hypothetical protein